MKIALLIVLALWQTGCAHLKPSEFNYTIAIDHAPAKVAQHWFGLSWSLEK